MQKFKTRESKEQIYMNCASSLTVLNSLAARYNIILPNISGNGEVILYYLSMTDRWDEERATLFLIIYSFYIFKCRLRNKMPTNEDFEQEFKL